MTKRIGRLPFALALLGTLVAGAAAAHEISAGGLVIDHPWARAPLDLDHPVAVYFVVENTTAAEETLLGARTPLAERAEIHKTVHEGDMVRMEAAAEVPIPPQDLVAFEPNALHLMLFGLKRLLSAGEEFPLTLVFENAGEVTVTVLVEEPGAMAPMHMSPMDMDH